MPLSPEQQEILDKEPKAVVTVSIQTLEDKIFGPHRRKKVTADARRYAREHGLSVKGEYCTRTEEVQVTDTGELPHLIWEFKSDPLEVAAIVTIKDETADTPDDPNVPLVDDNIESIPANW